MQNSFFLLIWSIFLKPNEQCVKALAAAKQFFQRTKRDYRIFSWEFVLFSPCIIFLNGKISEHLRVATTVWKVSKYGVFSGPYFTAFVFSPNAGKHRPEETPYLDIFHVDTWRCSEMLPFSKILQRLKTTNPQENIHRVFPFSKARWTNFML